MDIFRSSRQIDTLRWTNREGANRLTLTNGQFSDGPILRSKQIDTLRWRNREGAYRLTLTNRQFSDGPIVKEQTDRHSQMDHS